MAPPWLLRLRRQIEHSRTPDFFKLKKEGPELAPFRWEDPLGGKCALPDTQIWQSTKAAPNVAPPFGEGIFGGNTARDF